MKMTTGTKKKNLRIKLMIDKDPYKHTSLPTGVDSVETFALLRRSRSVF